MPVIILYIYISAISLQAGRNIAETYVYTYSFWSTWKFINISRTLPRCFRLMTSTIRLSVTFLHPTHRVELFGNIFAPFNSFWTRTVCVKTLERNWKGSKWSCKLSGREYETLTFFGPIYHFISTGYNWKNYRYFSLTMRITSGLLGKCRPTNCI